MGTCMAQQHLRNILAYLDAPTLGQPEVFVQSKSDLFNQDGSIEADSLQFLRHWMDCYVAWVMKHTTKVLLYLHVLNFCI
jgi:chromate reductase